MILNEGHSTEDLQNYLDGKIEMGKGVGIPDLDRHIVHKDGEFSIFLGHDNVGKTFWIEWWLLALSTNHDLTWTLWLGENKPWQAIRNLIQFYSGKFFKDLNYRELQKYQSYVEHYFKFVDNSKLYKPEEMLDLFGNQPTDGFLIDPFTGLDRQFTHEANYQFLNMVRQFCNSTKKSLYMSTHPNSESGRNGNLYPKDHDWSGHLRPPLKDHIEGGKPFMNRVDNAYIIHRLIKHNGDMKYKTMIDVGKVKDQETGGLVTGLDNPILCDFNSGLGFSVFGKGGIKKQEYKQESLNTNDDFDKCPF